MKSEIKMKILRTRTRFEPLTGRPYVGGHKTESCRQCVCSSTLCIAACKSVDIKYDVIFTICGPTHPAVARTSILLVHNKMQRAQITN